MYPTFCRPFFYVALLACAAFACAKPPQAVLGARAEQKPPSLQVWEEEVMRFVQAQNAWLWQHWTSGTPWEEAPVHAFFEKRALEETWKEMQAMPLPTSRMQACALQNLQAFVLGELLALGLREHNHAVARLESQLTVMHQARDFPWYELGRLLAYEKDAVHRKNLWLYSLKKARLLEGALQARKQKTAQLLEQLGMDEARATQLFRNVDLEALSLTLQARLEETQSPWCAQVQALAASQGDMETATRADLPFFFQAKHLSEARYFPAQQQAAVVDAVFERLGLWPSSRLVRHIAEAQLPLPLALNGGLGVSQLSLAPAQGLGSLRQWLGNMGRAVSWTHVAQSEWACRHLGPPIVSNASALVFARLAQDKSWLAEQAVPETIAEEWERVLGAQAELEFRKTAAHFLAHMASRTLGPNEAATTYVSLQAEVLCVQPLEAEAARLHVEGEEFFAMADQLRSALLAEHMWKHLQARFGKTWWHAPEAGAWLRALWHEGNAVPAELAIATSPTLPSSR